MNGLPYYKAYPRDFFEGTIGFGFELKGAYRLLIDLIYQHGGDLTDDPRFIAGHLGCSVRAWNGYRAELIARGKISCQNGIISNFRADKELEILGSFQEKQRKNRSHPNKNNNLSDTMVSPKRDHTDTDTEKEEEGACAREAFFAQIRAAANVTRMTPYWASSSLADAVARWEALGLTEEQIVKAAAESRTKNPDQPDGPKALDRWMEGTAKSQASTSTAPAKEPKHGRTVNTSLTVEERAKFWAEKINANTFVPPSAVTPTMARSMLDQGLVTPEQLKVRGIAA